MASTQFDDDPDPAPDPVLLKGNNPAEMTAPSPTIERSQLGVHFQPSDSSVICGRGKFSYNHPGNRRFRVLLSMFVKDYSKAVKAGRKLVKSAIVSTVVAMVRQTGGCFCKLEKGGWYEVGDYCAREKVSALFRDMLHAQDRASAKAEIARRKAQVTGLPDDSSISSSPCSGSNTDVSTLFRDILPAQERSSTTKAEITRRKAQAIQLPDDSSISSSPCSGSNTDVSVLFRDMMHAHDRSSTTKAEIDCRKAQGTGLPDDSSISSSPCYGSNTDSLGFDHLLDVDFFDIDVVF
jgi:hypothetical protein